ncbi:MAG: hypothetical protein EAZ23_25870 [Oscillatoriales cyanobacterium]|nr:MAG: hypothetical protein EAZ23_25870 [Oscillatoriales cyanobacterium]
MAHQTEKIGQKGDRPFPKNHRSQIRLDPNDSAVRSTISAIDNKCDRPTQHSHLLLITIKKYHIYRQFLDR